MKSTVALLAGALAILVLAAPLTARAQSPEPCAALLHKHFEGFQIQSAGLADLAALPGDVTQSAATVVKVCRIAGVAEPTPDSLIGFEVWIPVSTQPTNVAWNRRVQVFGNGGYVGQIPFADMKLAVAKGYAAAGGDTGHVTTAMPEDLSFVVGHPEKAKDWGYRSIHEVIKAARAVIIAEDGAAPHKAYFFGCSTGGGQGLAEAQRYPADFDGIVAGAPGNNRTHLNAAALWGFAQNHASGEGAIPPAKFVLLNQATLKACDGLDGVVDGMMADPRRCRFDPSVLACSGADRPDCFTTAELATLGRIQGGARNPRTGARIYPPWPVGTEAVQGLAVNGAQPPRVDFWKYWVFDDPSWDWRRFDFDKDMAFADAKVGPYVNNVDPDLRTFTAHGGKLLLYHGWADPIGNAYDTIDYMDAVRSKTPGADRSVALYLIPGMGHCRGGPGADTFDKVGLIEAWVERGEAPGRIVAQHLEKGAVTLTRPLCRYPLDVVYAGKGGPKVESSFICRAP